MRLGIDVGSTTVKLVFLDEDNNIIYSRYERHMSNAFLKVQELIKEAHEEFGDRTIQAVITGSGGLSIAKLIKVPFEQEV
ncbi:MAG: activator of (R)-2-hydroxyglutaryl-CoA dehydratase, partial [Firmicutes bacterium]|nr:activator of (R)-2-hydroxyglutaryl-CoA dehydratase [Bacillota bacterium]